ncbi:PLP-dependent transferase [Chiua virens]|nr:PLP-dependent transferase [Chiua virens]
MSMPTSCLAYRLSRGVLTAIQPPIPRAKAWGSAYPATPASPLFDMSQGVPGKPPPDVLLDALGKTSSSPQTSSYGPALGEPKFRAAFAQEMKMVYGKNIDITAEDVAVTAGCNMSFIAAVMCLADAGDEVIIPVPWYFNHAMDLDLLSIKPVPLYTRSNQGFLPSVHECKKLISSKTKAIALVTPNNPTGATYPPQLIARFAELAREHDIALILDETYRDFVEQLPPHDLFSPVQKEILPSTWSWRSNVVHLFSFSKSYAIPGHRLGAVIASPELLKYVTTTLDCIQVCPPRSPQLALATPTLLSELRTSIESNAKALKARHALFRASLPPGWTIGSQGGYYAYVKHPFQDISSIEFCKRLAMELGVLVLPAQFFYGGRGEMERAGNGSEEGWDTWVRFSVANVSDEQVVRVCERLKECDSLFGSG